MPSIINRKISIKLSVSLALTLDIYWFTTWRAVRKAEPGNRREHTNYNGDEINLRIAFILVVLGKTEPW